MRWGLLWKRSERRQSERPITSVRRYLLNALMAVLAVAGAVAVLAAYLITDHEMEEILDTQLSLHARIVASQLSSEPTAEALAALATHLNLPGHPAGFYPQSGDHAQTQPLSRDQRYHEEERRLVVGFWRPNGQPYLMGGPWQDHGAFPAPSETGYRWADYNGYRWRVFSMQDQHSGLWISLGLRRSFHDAIVQRITLNNLLPMLLLLPVLLWSLNRIIRRGLAPINQLSQQVQGRDAQDLSRLDEPVPREIEGLQQSLNGFIDRLDKTLERERRFSADAAHEMRTPLAAIRIHLDNALAGEQASLHKAYTGVERLQRVVEQLLTLVRLDRGGRVTPKTSIDVYPIVIELMADLYTQAHQRHQRLSLTGLMALNVRADATEVGILFRNLVDNALRYTPEGGEIEVILGCRAGHPFLCVQDSGPGIPEHLMAHMTERFRRASDQSITGSGLGLSIVHELVTLQQAELQLSNRQPHGLEVTVLWPAVSR